MIEAITSQFVGKDTTGNQVLCVVTRASFRLYLPQIYEWESQDKIPKGLYLKIVKLLRHTLPEFSQYKEPGTTAVVHFRRGDKINKGNLQS